MAGLRNIRFHGEDYPEDIGYGFGRGYARADYASVRGQTVPPTGTVPLMDNNPTLPGPPSGYSLVDGYVDPIVTTLNPSTQFDSVDLYCASPFGIDAPTIDSIMANFQGQILPLGYEILAWEFDSQPGASLTIPTEIDLGDGSPITIPATICFDPFGLINLGCVNVGGQTIIQGTNYHLWLMVASPQSSVASAVRGQIPIVALFPSFLEALGIFLLIIGAVLAYEILTGKITLQQLLNFLTSVGQIPGNNFAAAAQGAEIPLVVFGLVAVLAGVGIPALSLGGNVTGPGGVGGGGNIGIGQGAYLPPPASAPTGKRR